VCEFEKEIFNILQILMALILSQDRFKIQDQARMAELVDARDLKSLFKDFLCREKYT
jgi:hypothetical protein